MYISAKTLYKIGSASMMIVGAGHLMAHFSMDENDPATAPIYKQMNDFKLDLLGIGSRSLLELQDGFSITMGVLIFFVGLQNFFLSRSLKYVWDNNKGLIIVPTLLAGISLILSLKYFFIVPQALDLIAFIAFPWSLWQLRKEKVLQSSVR